VFLLVPKVVAAVNGVITGAFGGMLFDYINTVTDSLSTILQLLGEELEEASWLI